MEEEFYDFFDDDVEEEKEEEMIIEEDEKGLEEDDDVRSSKDDIFQSIEYITSPRLTKYERAKIIGMRATQLSQGANPTIIPKKGMSIYDIALEEIKQKKCPYIIKRYLPDGSYEQWKVNDLDF